MCNQCNDPFHDLDDNLDDLLGTADESKAVMPAQPGSHTPLRRDGSLADAMLDGVTRATVETRAATAGHRYVEKCEACGGTGRFRSYTGRIVGNCFKCDGVGTVTFKTSPESRAAAKNARERMKEQQAATRRANVAAWAEKYADDYAWMLVKAPTFEFAQSMLEALHKYGALTVKQRETVTRLRERDAEREKQRAAEKAAREANAPAINVEKIEIAFCDGEGKGHQAPQDAPGRLQVLGSPCKRPQRWRPVRRAG